MLRLDCCIAGIVWRIESDFALPIRPIERLARFRIPSALPDVRLRFHYVEQTAAEMDALADVEIAQFHSWRNVQSLSRSLLISRPVQARLRACWNHRQAVSIEVVPSAIAIIDFASLEFDLFCTSDWVKSERFISPSVFAFFLPKYSAVMVHSSAVSRNGLAALFLAPDEGGKTTAAKHAPLATILCDDQNIIRRQGKELIVHSTPWCLCPSGPRDARLGGLFLLEQANDFALFPVKPLEVFEYLWNEHQDHRDQLPKEQKMSTFEFLWDVSRAVPAYRMRFPKHYVDWAAIDAAMMV